MRRCWLTSGWVTSSASTSSWTQRGPSRSCRTIASTTRTSTTGSAGTGSSTTGTGSRPSAGDQVHMLGTEEIDELGSGRGIDVDEQGEGQTPTEEIEAARAKSEEPLTGDRPQDGEDPDSPRA